MLLNNRLNIDAVIPALLECLMDIDEKRIRVCYLGVYLFLLVVLSGDVNAYQHTSIHSQAEHLEANSYATKSELKAKAHEMFMHGYNGYMKYAFPHDELMPISCKGRKRGVTPTRGDVDDSLGNFSLTLVDTLDTLVVVGEYDEFERAVHLIVNTVKFDADLVVSVFETNIRMVGGLISGHLVSDLLKAKEVGRLKWYSDELLVMACQLADRLLPAFNTTSGVPHSRVNLKRGLTPELKNQLDTCTACGGTMILEWAALSRLSGNPIYEEKARRAMDFLWNQRNRGSDLMGTVLNVNSGDWIRRDSGIGAGIDSYYEYTLKAYILLGEEDYLYRFNKHYDAVMRYLSKGPMFIDVHMHKPNIASRSFMDALLAFWPGVQVLKGDLKSAIEVHEMLYSVVKKHKFLPDAFTHDFQVHWAQHPLRPEFIESTYFLYRATKDPHYLEVAKQVMLSLEENVRTSCGFAAVKDVRTMDHEDEMESFVLAETFKYLYMIFTEPSDLLFDPDNYVLTTEAHFLPLSLGNSPLEGVGGNMISRRIVIDPDELINSEEANGGSRLGLFRSACPNTRMEFKNTKDLHLFGISIRNSVQKLFDGYSDYAHDSLDDESTMIDVDFQQSCSTKANERLRAWAFSATNSEHLLQLKKMGIQIDVRSDGTVQLNHVARMAESAEWAISGFKFMQEMNEMSLEMEHEKGSQPDRVVQIISEPYFGIVQFVASPAHFGAVLDSDGIDAEIERSKPLRGCSAFINQDHVRGRIAVVERGQCMFQEKARFAQQAGAVGIIITDNQIGSSAEQSPLFSMSAEASDHPDDITIPVVFLFHYEAQKLLNQQMLHPTMVVHVAEAVANPTLIFERYLRHGEFTRRRLLLENDFVSMNEQMTIVRFKFYFVDRVNGDTDPIEKHLEVERNVEALSCAISFADTNRKHRFLASARSLAYALFSFPYGPELSEVERTELRAALHFIRILPVSVDAVSSLIFRSSIRAVECRLGKGGFCKTV